MTTPRLRLRKLERRHYEFLAWARAFMPTAEPESAFRLDHQWYVVVRMGEKTGLYAVNDGERHECCIIILNRFREINHGTYTRQAHRQLRTGARRSRNHAR